MCFFVKKKIIFFSPSPLLPHPPSDSQRFSAIFFVDIIQLSSGQTNGAKGREKRRKRIKKNKKPNGKKRKERGTRVLFFCFVSSAKFRSRSSQVFFLVVSIPSRGKTCHGKRKWKKKKNGDDSSKEIVLFIFDFLIFFFDF